MVFGAAVRPDGSPSPTLARRIAFAAAAATRYVDADLFCSGAKGTYGPSEASVMAEVLEETVDRSRIHLDETSVDTLQSVVAATAFARAGQYAQCMICTDGYHQPRIRMLFAMLGMPASAIHMPHGGSRRYQLKMRTREAAAIPYDLVAGIGAIWRRNRG
ncbi:YdcF family protein [Sphingomonas faeni]|uniref:YdcF family protein n=1 Tax=Sphingomonas faeni TaxID=185950 RepID=UPI0033651470